jgi:S1-C subfamily serine protease
VIEGAHVVMVKLGKELRSAEIVRKSQTADLAVLKVEAKTTGLPLATSRNVKLGERVYTVGFPKPPLQGHEPKFNEGSVSSLAGFQDDFSNFQISAPIQPGNSGGPLANAQGEVIGIVVAKLRGGENVNYAIKSSTAQILLEQVSDLKPVPMAASEKRSQEEIAAVLTQSTVMIVTY